MKPYFKWAIFLVFVLLIAILISSDTGNTLINWIISFSNSTNTGKGIITALIGGLFAVIAAYIKTVLYNATTHASTEIKIGYENITEKILNLTNTIDITRKDIESLRHDFSEMKLSQSTREEYEKQLTKVINTAIGYFNVDSDLQSFVRYQAEEFKNFTVSIQQKDLKDLEYEDIKQSGITLAETIYQRSCELLGNEAANYYRDNCYLGDWKIFMNKVKYIINDPVNNKNYRFFSESTTYLQTSMSRTLECWMNYNKK